MYRYTIGQGQWDYYSNIELFHNSKYSSKEFIDICRKAFSELSFEERKEICYSFGDEGVELIKNILIQDFGFTPPNKVASHIHLRDLLGIKDYKDEITCEDCSKSYEVNGKIQCAYDECERKKLLKEKFE